MRATLDTNVFVSALVFGGVLGRILDLHTDEAFLLCTSPAIMTELQRVLAERFEWAEEEIEITLKAIFPGQKSSSPRQPSRPAPIRTIITFLSALWNRNRMSS
jgi:PIN domain